MSVNTHKCGRCGEEKPETGFSWKDKRRGRRHTVCKACHKEYRRQHYLDNIEIYKAKARRWNKANQATRRERLRDYLYNYLLTHPCVDCGETDPIVLEFDHVRGTKKANISYLVRAMAGLETIQAEVAKCDVRCANCHRRKTYQETGSWLLDRLETDDPDNSITT